MASTALALPDRRLWRSWAETVRDFGDEFPHGSGSEIGGAALDEKGCAAFAAGRLRYADPGAALPEGKVRCTFFWVLDGATAGADGEVIGFLAVRHALNDFLLEQGGHIGYSIRPAARGRGHAGRALRLGLAHAAGLGLDRVLLTCDPDNEPSRRTIVAAGGVYEDTRAGSQRYWIDLSGAAGDGCAPALP